jgi:hypothetical protein
MPGREIDLTGYFKYAEPMEKEMTFDEWLEYGFANGFCSRQYCSTHAGDLMTETEELIFEDGYDCCIHVVRLGTPDEWEQEAQAIRDSDDQV